MDVVKFALHTSGIICWPIKYYLNYRKWPYLVTKFATNTSNHRMCCLYSAGGKMSNFRMILHTYPGYWVQSLSNHSYWNKFKLQIDISHKNKSLNSLGPLCLWQYFLQRAKSERGETNEVTPLSNRETLWKPECKVRKRELKTMLRFEWKRRIAKLDSLNDYFFDFWTMSSCPGMIWEWTGHERVWINEKSARS